MTEERATPTQDDVLGYFDTLSNWGRWGDDDELGTLNNITADVRRAAAQAVRHGTSVSCGWEMAAPAGIERSTTAFACAADMPGAEGMPAGFHRDRRWGFSSEQLSFTFHGNTHTHLDSPCHIFWDGAMYNGRACSLVDAAGGSAWAAVTAAANGVVTRGVLLDIPKVRDVPWLEPGQGVFPDDLDEAERRQGVRVRSGDAVLLRTGHGRVRHEQGDRANFMQAGWHASCLPWLHERDVALIGADTPQDVQPSGYDDVLMPVHAVSLVAMGLWLLDNCDLEACATTAAEAPTVGLPPRRRTDPLRRRVRQPGQPDRHVLAICAQSKIASDLCQMCVVWQWGHRTELPVSTDRWKDSGSIDMPVLTGLPVVGHVIEIAPTGPSSRVDARCAIGEKQPGGRNVA